jgi:hypothetical protein
MRRVIVSALVLAGAAGLARLPPPRLTAGSIDLAEAGEVATYVAGARPVRVRVAAGQRLVRILTNLDLGREAPAQGIPYLIRVRIEEDGRDERFPAVGQPALDAHGAPAMLIPGSAITPGRTREVAIARDREGAATLEISLLEPRGAQAALRVLVLEERPPTAGQTLVRRLARARARPADTGFLAHRWVRAGALPPVASRRLYLLGEPATPVRDTAPKGDPAGPGLALAYTLSGPGSVRLSSTEGRLSGVARLIDETGRERTQMLAAGEGAPVSFSIGAGLTSVRVEPDLPTRVLAQLGDGARPLLPTNVDVLPASWTVEAWDLALPGQPLRWSLGDRRDGPLRLEARVLPGPGAPTSEVAIGYRFADRLGNTLASGELAGPVVPAQVDRLDGDPPGPVSAALTGFVWPPRAAERIELTAPVAAAVTVASTGFAAGPPPPRARVRLVHAPVDRPRWYRVKADGTTVQVRLRVATTIESQAPPPPSAQVATLEPLGRPAKFALLVPAAAGQPARPGSYWPVVAGRAIEVAATGVSPRARIAPRLLYLSERGSPGVLTASFDGGAGVPSALAASRGQLTLAPVAPGAHQLRVEAPAGLRLFVDQPVDGTSPYRLVTVHELRPGAPLAIAFQKRPAARALGLELYSDQPLGAQAQLLFTIDGGAPRVARGVLARGFTDGARALPVTTRAVPGAVHLQRRSAGVCASAPLFLPFGDDAVAGPHRVTVAIAGARGPVFVRFFSYGGEPAPDRLTHYARREVGVTLP